MVIVVEESDELRSTMASTLRHDGHEVIELSDGAQLLARLMGVALLDRRRESVAVVTSSQASVLAVLRMLRSARWRTPVVLVTNEVPRAPEGEIDAVATLAKPVDLDALRAAVWEAVTRRPSAGSWASRPGG